MAAVDATETKANGVVGFEWDRKAARDRHALNSLKATTIASLHVTGWETLILGPARTS